MNRRSTRYFELARREASCSTFDQYRLGAVITSGNYVVARGRNRPKSHPMQLKYEKYRGRTGIRNHVHAEVDALIRSGYEDLTGCEIFVYRETKAGHLANSKPCPACMQAIKDSGIQYIYFTSEDGIKSIALY